MPYRPRATYTRPVSARCRIVSIIGTVRPAYCCSQAFNLSGCASTNFLAAVA